MDGKVSNFQQAASLRRYTLTSGREHGLEVIDCDNGTIRFLLNVGKALDMMQLYHKGQNISFISKNGFSAREAPFLNRFEGGMIYTCGLDNIGGERNGLPVHGSYHNTAAEIVLTQCDEQGIVVEAVIRNTALFGSNLVMRRRITSAIGSDSVQIEDELTNLGYKDERYCLLYHTNIGYPMLDEGVSVHLDAKECRPRTEWSARNMDTRLLMEQPVDANEETCYFMTLNKPEVRVVNPKLGKTLSLTYSQDTLPCFVEWKSMASGDYALGLEPCTTELDDTFAYRILPKQESITFSLCLSVTDL